MSRPFGYPLTAGRITVVFSPFAWLLVPRGRIRRELTERARQQGERIWWFRWLCFQIEYNRWV